MWSVSQRYLDTLKRSHVQVSALQILKNGVVYAEVIGGRVLDPATGAPMNALGGTVTVSSTTIRRNCSLQVLDPLGQLTPTTVSALLAPYVTEVRAYTGVRYWDATAIPDTTTSLLQQKTSYELVPIGTFVITNPNLQSNQLTVEGYDRMWYLANFAAPYPIADGTPIDDAITDLLTAMVPHNKLQVNLPSTGVTVDGNVAFDANTNSGDAAQLLAQAAGWKLYCDPMGVFSAYVPPSTTDTPTLTLAPGVGSVIMHPQRQLGSTDAVNAVVYSNEGGQNTPLRGYAEDDNPASLTNVGTIGVRPTFVSNPALATQNDLDTAALTELNSLIGLSDTITVIMMPNHALEVDDILAVTDLSQGINNMNVLADNFTVSMRASDGTMAVQCKANVITTA